MIENSEVVEIGEFSLPMPGMHNISNATAAIAIALELGVDVDSIRKGFKLLAVCVDVSLHTQVTGIALRFLMIMVITRWKLKVYCPLRVRQQG